MQKRKGLMWKEEIQIHTLAFQEDLIRIYRVMMLNMHTKSITE